MRHVSKNHRVALDWLFDRYIDTKHQFADILTRVNFTRDEWNNLLHRHNINHFSSICRAQNFSLTSCTKTMAKKMHEQKEDDRIVAKSKPTAMNLAVSVSTSSSFVNSPIASKSLGILEASSGKPDARARRNSKPDAASSSQGWLKDAHLSRLMVNVTVKLVATEQSGTMDISCLEEETAQMEDRFFRGRHTAYLTYTYFRKTEHMKLFLNIEINSVLLRTAIQNFDNCWDQVFLSTSEVPTDSILESLYKRRTRVSSTRAGALSCLVTRPRPLTFRMSPEVQGHRPARPHEIFIPETNELKQEYF